MRTILLFLALSTPALGAEGLYWHTELKIWDADPQYWDPNPITSVHESTHGLNSRLRNRFGGQCLFLFHNRFARIQRAQYPRLNQVALKCRYRGPVFYTYLVHSQQWWNDWPTYLLDEWVAYINGAEVACSRFPGNRAGNHWSEVLHALEMAHYCEVMIDNLLPSYPDHQQVRKLFLDQSARILFLYDQRIHHHPDQDAWAYHLRQARSKYELR